MNKTLILALLFVLAPLAAVPADAQLELTHDAALVDGSLDATVDTAGPFPAADQDSFHTKAIDGSFYLQYDNARVVDGRSGQGVDLGTDAGDGLGFPGGAPSYASGIGLVYAAAKDGTSAASVDAFSLWVDKVAGWDGLGHLYLQYDLDLDDDGVRDACVAAYMSYADAEVLQGLRVAPAGWTQLTLEAAAPIYQVYLLSDEVAVEGTVLAQRVYCGMQELNPVPMPLDQALAAGGLAGAEVLGVHFQTSESADTDGIGAPFVIDDLELVTAAPAVGDGFVARTSIAESFASSQGTIVQPVDGRFTLVVDAWSLDGVAYKSFEGSLQLHAQSLDENGPVGKQVATATASNGQATFDVAVADLPSQDGVDLYVVEEDTYRSSHHFAATNALLADASQDALLAADALQGPAQGEGQPFTPVMFAEGGCITDGLEAVEPRACGPDNFDGYVMNIEVVTTAGSQQVDNPASDVVGPGAITINGYDSTVAMTAREGTVTFQLSVNRFPDLAALEGGADRLFLSEDPSSWAFEIYAYPEVRGGTPLFEGGDLRDGFCGGCFLVDVPADVFTDGSLYHAWAFMDVGTDTNEFGHNPASGYYNALKAAGAQDPRSDLLDWSPTPLLFSASEVFEDVPDAPVPEGDGFVAFLELGTATPAATVVDATTGTFTVDVSAYVDGAPADGLGLQLHAQTLDADGHVGKELGRTVTAAGNATFTVDVDDLPAAAEPGWGYGLFVVEDGGDYRSSHHSFAANAMHSQGLVAEADLAEGEGQERVFTPVMVSSSHPDPDGDGVPSDPSGEGGEPFDNCPTTANEDQADFDGDGDGDACDDDDDDDGTPDSQDAFPRDANETKDTDNDGIGNNADADDDNDGTPDDEDAFPLDASEDTDSDGDGVGDNADADDDGDGVDDADDNCPLTANHDQADLDGDGAGDACDDDIDGDGVANDADAFPLDASEDTDSDGDGVGDNSDAFPDDPDETEDSDGDGVGDNSDNCPGIANDSQADVDSDGTGDACDLDNDNDGVNVPVDKCPEDATEWKDSDGDGVCDGKDAFPHDASETVDSDGDGVGDNSDAYPTDASEWADSDSDGIGDNADNCVDAANHDQADLDGDGVGDVCDGDRDGDNVADDVDAYPDDPDEWADSDNDGVPDGVDDCPGHDDNADRDNDGVPNGCDALPDDPAESGYDGLARAITQDLATSLRGQAVQTEQGVTMRLRFDADDRADGYQVWRSMSPYELIATLPANATGYDDTQSAAGAKYVVTAYVERGGTKYGYAEEAADITLEGGVEAVPATADGTTVVLTNSNSVDENQTIRVEITDARGARTVNRTVLVPAGESVEVDLRDELDGAKAYKVFLDTGDGEEELTSHTESKAFPWLPVALALMLVAVAGLVLVAVLVRK